MDTEHNRIKRLLVKTPIYCYLLKMRAAYETRAVTMAGAFSDKVKPNTAYCISPYKTGTTYITGLFKNSCRAAHEPLQYTTLLNIDHVEFLKKRARYLNLDIECSGFFANRLSQLRKFAPDAPVLFLSRAPEAWIGSVVNYFSKLGARVTYNYVARMIFDPICDGRIEDFYALPPMKQATMVTALLQYWIRVYAEAGNDTKALIIPLERVDEYLMKIEEFFGHKAKAGIEVWKRENRDKKQFFLGDYVDLSLYKKDIRALGYL